MSFDTVSEEELTNILQNYIDARYWSIIDFSYVIQNARIENDVVWFDMCMFTLGLKMDTLEYYDVTDINGFEGAVI